MGKVKEYLMWAEEKGYFEWNDQTDTFQVSQKGMDVGGDYPQTFFVKEYIREREELKNEEQQ